MRLSKYMRRHEKQVIHYFKSSIRRPSFSLNAQSGDPRYFNAVNELLYTMDDMSGRIRC